MEIVNQLAGLVGLSPTMFIVIVVAAVVLLGGLAILKAVLQFAWKTFMTGCLFLILLIGGLYIGSLLLSNAP